MKDTHSCGTFAVAIEVVANLPTTFASLDSDLVRSIAAALLVHGPVRSPNCAVAAASYKVCLDRRAPSVSALSRTSKSVREALSSMLNIMRAEHDKRMMLLSAFSTEVLQTDLQVLQRARDAFSLRGCADCAGCGRTEPFLHGLFLAAVESPLSTARVPQPAAPVLVTGESEDDEDDEDDDDDDAAEAEATAVARAAVRAALEEEDEDDVHPDTAPAQLMPGRAYCAHCWRAAYGLLMRPCAVAGEQLWTEPIEEGTWRYVEDFSHRAVDSPLLSPDEIVREIRPHFGADEIYAALRRAGYVLEPRSPVHTWRRLAGSPPTGALHPAGSLIDLIGSGHCAHLLAIDLSDAGLDDKGLALLSRALVGNALLLRFLSISYNPITDEGVEAFARVLAPRPFDLVLPLLKWLYVEAIPLAIDEGQTAASVAAQAAEAAAGAAAEAAAEAASEAAFVEFLNDPPSELQGFGGRGARALAAALRGHALPSLELLVYAGSITEAFWGAPPEVTSQTENSELKLACEERGVVLFSMST
jgi:hypothetical protein